jgi:hypothetical protein
MKLILEQADDVSFITEASENGKKNLFIEGCYMVYGQGNKNGRVYSENVMRKEVNRYLKEVVSEKRAYGELNHPSGPQINLDRVSHLIENLEVRPNGVVWGRAKVLDTPMGNIARGLIEGGANLGVSSRGLGSLKAGQNGLMEVQDDFRIVTAADIVADPSAPGAFVQGIMENVEYFYNEQTGEFVEKIKENVKKMSSRQLEEQKVKLFEQFLKSL